jgi:hypothetical protein
LGTLDLGQKEQIKQISLITTQDGNEFYANNFEIQQSDKFVHKTKQFLVNQSFWNEYSYDSYLEKGEYSVIVSFVNDYEDNQIDTELHLSEIIIDNESYLPEQFEGEYGHLLGNKAWKFPANGFISKNINLSQGNHEIKIIAKTTEGLGWPKMLLVIENTFKPLTTISNTATTEGVQTKMLTADVNTEARYLRVIPNASIRYALINEVIVK